MNEIHASLDLLFKPRTVAIYEAKEKLSYFILGFQTMGFNMDNLFLINRTEEEVLGFRCYKSITDIPVETIDLLILAVGRNSVVESMKELIVAKSINFIHIFTAGTGEFDEKGLEVERELKQILDDNPKIKAIGPNCMGVYCPEGHNAYLPIFPKENGNIGLIFHSGDLHTRAALYGYSRYGLTFSKGASVGNCISLKVTDFLEYLGNDEATDMIGVYFEGFSRYEESEGRKLIELAKKIKKPILFMRGGVTKRAQAAVLTHTGSLGSNDKIWKGAFKQTPLVEVGSSLDEMVDYLYIFSMFIKRYKNLKFNELLKKFPKTKDALVILWSGGLGILDTDTLTKLGVNLPEFTGKSKERLLEIYPIRVGSLSNPLDLPWVSRSDKYLEVCKAATEENVDLVVMHTNAWGMRDKDRFKSYYDNLKKIRGHVESLDKILVMILAEAPIKYRRQYYELLISDGFIVYPDLTRAAKSFLALHEYGKNIMRLHH